MLLRNRPPSIDSQPGTTAEGFEHLSGTAVSVLRWLKANKVEHVLVGPVAEAIRGSGGEATAASGAVAIVPAPYGRNLHRLCRALSSSHSRLRIEGEESTTPIKLNEEKLLGGGRWTLRCGAHDLDIEGRPSGAPSYQELLYEAGKFTLAPDLTVDVAAPADVARYARLRRNGDVPEIRITRNATERKPAGTERKPADTERNRADT